MKSLHINKVENGYIVTITWKNSAFKTIKVFESKEKLINYIKELIVE